RQQPRVEVQAEALDDAELVAVADRRVEHAREEVGRFDDQLVALPAADRVPGAARLHVGWGRLSIEVDRALEPHLSVADHDRPARLEAAVDGTVERPVEENARRLAAKARIVVAREAGGRPFAHWREFRSAVQTRSRRRPAASAA